MTRRCIAAVLFALNFAFILPLTAKANNSIEISARSAALYVPQTNEFLYTKNANERLGMASTTKIMTALIALERLSLDHVIEIDERAIGIDGSSIYLEKGEIMSAEALIYALMLRSANDAAEALAYEICGNIEDFCVLMNERAASIGLSDTNFMNPHGLDASEHYTTAHDLALICAEALRNDKFKEISSTYKKDIESNLKTRTLVNHNKLLKRYDGCIGVKTGYTQKCGRSLVGAAERDGLTLISVTIDAPDDWNDHEKLLDNGFSTTRAITIAEAGDLSISLPVINGASEFITVTNKNRIQIVCRSTHPDIQSEITLPQSITKSVQAGEVVGKITYTLNEKTVAETELIAQEGVQIKKKKSFFERIFK